MFEKLLSTIKKLEKKNIFTFAVREKKIGFFIGAFFLCLFATLQKKSIGAPLVISGYIVPFLFGGVSGFIITSWYSKLETAKNALQKAHDNLEIKIKERTKELEMAFSEIKTLKGVIPICSHCKKIRDGKGYWEQLEAYIQKHSDAEFSHGICEECVEKYYPNINLYDEDKTKK